MKEFTQYIMGMPDSIYTLFDILSDTCHPVPFYLNNAKVFLLLSDLYRNPKQGFKPRSLSECLLEFGTRSKPLGHHSRSTNSTLNAKNYPKGNLPHCSQKINQILNLHQTKSFFDFLSHTKRKYKNIFN